MQREALLRHRLNRTINFAQSNIADPLDLDQLADIACLSKYHFVRVFQGYMKEPPYQFLKRIRLERAARNLAYLRSKPITDIALDCGFSSSQAFSNAFRRRFRTSPRVFRSINDSQIKGAPPIGQLAASLGPPENPFVDPTWADSIKIEPRPAYRLAYVRHIGPYFNVTGGISEAFATVERWAKHQGLWSDAATCIGLCPDNAALTPAGSCLYDAGIAVSGDVSEDSVVSIQDIPAGFYAVLKIACRSDQVNCVWDWFGSQWLPASNRTYELRHCYEIYPAWKGGAGRPETGVELCMRLST